MSALLLLAAAGFLYLQSIDGSGSDTARSEFAALSQAIPLHAGNALAGTPQEFTRLDADLKRLAELRRSSLRGIPGGSSAWDKLNQHAEAILAKRADVEAVQEAAAVIKEHMPIMTEQIDGLLGRSGATAVIQEFQRRGAQLVQSLDGLAGAEDAAAVASSVADDATYLRLVTDALSGASTNLDVAALDDALREVFLVPIISELTNIEEQLSRIAA
ncbi:MAG: hypothetical protein IH930_09150, partial [Proteobacteria bacterium]|nr:hypothetical protein [Pseudomonadota bacterium]